MTALPKIVSDSISLLLYLRKGNGMEFDEADAVQNRSPDRVGVTRKLSIGDTLKHNEQCGWFIDLTKERQHKTAKFYGEITWNGEVGWHSEIIWQGTAA